MIDGQEHEVASRLKFGRGLFRPSLLSFECRGDQKVLNLRPILTGHFICFPSSPLFSEGHIRAVIVILDFGFELDEGWRRARQSIQLEGASTGEEVEQRLTVEVLARAGFHQVGAMQRAAGVAQPARKAS